MARTYEPLAGETITQTADMLASLARQDNAEVQASFNDILLTALPTTQPWDILSYYHTESERRAEAYRNSEAYKEAQRQQEAASKAHREAFATAIAQAPASMTLRDREGWQASLNANQDPYGTATLRFADQWARLMESALTQGETLEACADRCASLADTEGITGFMYGCAVGILAQVWIHGEALRQWHNTRYQIGNEGDRANATGGVLNPALLNIG